MRISVENLRKTERILCDQHIESFNKLIESIPEDEDRDLISTNLHKLENKEKHKEFTQMINKFNGLKRENSKDLKSDESDQNSKNVTIPENFFHVLL